jgi:hypothetical protein
MLAVVGVLMDNETVPVLALTIARNAAVALDE